ncbi:MULTISPECIES: DDE-type integrase/transposase/recombinase [unclassified Spiroplasma]|uniref:DDE-type integrase/transposase/recombinase n=1 Tax=unclassified Spiroplasma TaxID=2637901 RepID=UPI00313DD6C8
MKYIIAENQLSDLEARLQCWLKGFYRDKNYHKTKKRINNYLNLCKQFYTEKNTLKSLIKKHFHNIDITFYRWAKKIITGYYENNFSNLIIKSTKPLNPHYQFNIESRKKICDLFYKYKNIKAGGVWSLYNNLLRGEHDAHKYDLPRNIRTFYRWIKSDPRYDKIRQKIKENKRYYNRYEVKEIGLIQMDAKHFPKSKYPVEKNMYVYDFIDEKTRMVFGYVYDSLGTNNAINAVQRAIYDFKKFGIEVNRIRTDNAPEFTTTNWSNKNEYKIKERPFSKYLKDNKIIHETTPIRSPQSNGKIERFHKNYNNLLLLDDIKRFNTNELQRYLNEYYYFYNFQRNHWTIKDIPFNFLNKLLKTSWN